MFATFLFNFMKIPLVLLQEGTFTKRQLSQSGKHAWSHFISAFLSSTEESEIVSREEF